MTDDDISRVDILLITDTLKCFVNWKPISDKIILARFKTWSRLTTFIRVNSTTEKASPDAKKKFSMQLDETCRNVDVGDIKIQVELNGKVANNNKD